MEEFQKHCADVRPNITYLAIGSAYSITGGNQQHPPFLRNIITNFPDFNVQIILVDPLLENPPEITKHFSLRKFDDNWYGKENLNIHIIRQHFSFNTIGKNTDNNNFSEDFLLSVINRTIAAKNETPQNTYLLFVHDFSGNYIDSLSDTVANMYQKLDSVTYHTFKKNIMIDLNNKIDAGCFVDMTSIYFHPLLFMNSLGALEIFNSFLLDDFDIYSISMQNYKNKNIKTLVMQTITYYLNDFASNILPYYRQIRLALERKIPEVLNLNLDRIRSSCLLDEIDFNYLKMVLEIPWYHDNTVPIIQKITKNILIKLISMTKFLDFYKTKNIRDDFFGDFIRMCNKINLDDHYQLLQTYRNCQKKLEMFLINVDASEYFTELNNYSVQYVTKYGKMPLFIELLLQDKASNIFYAQTNFTDPINNITVNDTHTIMEL
jgi:hypothetical protein